MADINRELEELAELTQKINAEMRLYGQVTKQTAQDLKDAEMKAKFGIENFAKGTEKGADAIGALGRAGGEAAKAMFQGKKGAAALNGSLDELTKAAQFASIALSLLIPGGPVIKAFFVGLSAAVGALGTYTKAANEMGDKLYKGYQGLAESGAAASDGMTGLFEDAKKLGLSMDELSDYTSLIAANSKDLALFAGSVYEGRQQFADMGKSMERYREGLMNAGMTQQQINDGMMGYLKLQSRVGLSQNKTTTELADGAKKYLLEMDALTKITGESRKAMEDQMEAARSEERFAAKLQELRSQGRVEEAKQLEKTNLILASQSKEAAQGFRDLSTGMITTEAAQKANILTQGEAMRQADKLSKGLTTAGEAATKIGTAAGATAKALTPLAKAGAAGDVIGDYSGALRLGVAAQNNFSQQLTDAEKEQAAQGMKGGKATDALVQKQTDLRMAQIKANEATERFVFAGIGPATDAMKALTKATTGSANALNKLFGIQGSGAEATKAETAAVQAGAGAGDTAVASAIMDQSKELNEEQLKILKEAQKAYRESVKNGTMLQKYYGIGLDAEMLKAKATMQMAEKGNVKSSAPTAGPSGTEGGGAQPVAPKAAEVISFGPGSGSAQSFAGLNDKLGDAVTRAAEEYKATTGNKIQLNSAKRDTEKQKELYDAWVKGGKQGMPVAPPGTSLHEKGLAVDIQNYNDPAAVAAMNRQGLQQKVAGDPVHFSFDGGGVLQGPESGYKPNMTMHGTEAIIPMKNGAVPVSLNLKDVLNSPSIGGVSEYGGINQGPMSTDLEAVKNIAAAAGAFDKASQTITDPGTWKQILSSGLATNYQLGTATIGTQGIEGLGQDIADRLAEIKEQSNVTTDLALKQVTDEFKAAMAQLSQQLSDKAGGQNENGMGSIAELLQELVSATKNGVDVQQKILATNY